jgi:PAS domain S-box-containing protein
MFRQYPTIRALRYKAVALFLVGGVEALAHLIFPNLFPWQSVIAAIILCAFIVLLLISIEVLANEVGRSSISGIAQNAIAEGERRYRSLFENMLEGFAYCEMLFDDHGRPTDFVYLAVNSSFGSLTGLADVVGKRFTEVIPGGKDSQPELLERYGRVVLTGEPERFEIEIKALGMWFSISAYSAGKRCFVAAFDNVTERKQAEEALLMAFWL